MCPPPCSLTLCCLFFDFCSVGRDSGTCSFPWEMGVGSVWDKLGLEGNFSSAPSGKVSNERQCSPCCHLQVQKSPPWGNVPALEGEGCTQHPWKCPENQWRVAGGMVWGSRVKGWPQWSWSSFPALLVPWFIPWGCDFSESQGSGQGPGAVEGQHSACAAPGLENTEQGNKTWENRERNKEELTELGLHQSLVPETSGGVSGAWEEFMAIHGHNGNKIKKGKRLR